MASTEALWTRVSAYNETTWPIAVALSVVAAFLAWRVFLRPGARTDTWMKAFLSFVFAWNGVVFFLIFVKNPISMFAGAPLFITVSLLFAVDVGDAVLGNDIVADAARYGNYCSLGQHWCYP